MSQINKSKLINVFEDIKLFIKPADAVYFCRDLEIVKQLINIDKDPEIARYQLRNFLIDNESKIDKENLLLINIKNYNESIRKLENIIKNFENILNSNLYNMSKEEIKEVKQKKIEAVARKKIEEERLIKAKKLAKNIDKIIPFYHYNKEENRYDIEILDSKIIVNGTKRDRNKNLNKLKKLEEDIIKRCKEDNNGIESLLKYIYLVDFEEIFNNELLGEHIRALILDNSAIENKIATNEEITELKMNNIEKYEQLVKNQDFCMLLPQIKKAIEKYIEYIDFDKLLIICAYRFNEALEKKEVCPEDINKEKILMNTVLSYIEGKNKTYKLNLYSEENNNFVNKKVIYSKKKLNECLRKIIKNSYLTYEQIEEKKQKVKSGEINLLDMDEDEREIIFDKFPLENLAILSDKNLLYIATKLNWDREKILKNLAQQEKCSLKVLQNFIDQKKIEYCDLINLYMNKTINIDQIMQIVEKIDLSKFINSYELIEYYNNSIQQDSNEETKEKYNRYVKLCKVINWNNKEKYKMFSEELMKQLIKNYNRNEEQQYIEKQEEFFKQGLLSIETILGRNNKEDIKNIIADLYMQDSISINRIKEFISNKNIEIQYMEELASKENIKYNKRLEILEQGWIDEEGIFILFLDNYIKDKDLLELAKKNIVNEAKAKSMIRNKSQQGNSEFQISISNNLQKIKPEESLQAIEDDDKKLTNNRSRMMIDPNERLKFFKLLGAKRVKKVTIPKSSPFYEYEFFAIPDEDGEFSDDSVIIAERFYEETEEHIREKIDREVEKQKGQKIMRNPYLIKFAIDNATYFFRGRDIRALREYSNKTETIKEEIVFKANHDLADETKIGDWAAGVLYAITKTMLSSDLKKYSKGEQRKKVVETLGKYYGHERFMEILDKLEKIDLGYYNCEILEEDDAR